MTSSQVEIDATPWKRISRRWMIVLGIMLALNGATLLLGVCSHTFRASSSLAASAAEPAPLATPQDQPAEASQLADPPTEAASASAAPTQTAVVDDATIETNAVAAQPSDSIPHVQSNSVELPATTVSEVPVNRDTAADVPVDDGGTNPLSVAIDATPPKAHVDVSLADTLIIINPPHTGGTVHYLVDDKTISLQPGEYFQVSSNDDRRVFFHRGGDLGDVETHAESGAFAFSVSEAGWDLSPATAAACERLLSICRPVTGEREASASR